MVPACECIHLHSSHTHACTDAQNSQTFWMTFMLHWVHVVSLFVHFGWIKSPFSHTVSTCYFLFVNCFDAKWTCSVTFNNSVNIVQIKRKIQEIIGVVFFYQELHLHSSQQVLHIISICHRKTSKNQNQWLPDRKHLFPVAVRNDTIITEKGWGGWNNYWRVHFILFTWLFLLLLSTFPWRELLSSPFLVLLLHKPPSISIYNPASLKLKKLI